MAAQEDQDFDWVVVDGGSVDDTLSIARTFPVSRSTIISASDFGIYDALNTGIGLIRGQYYLVLGSDDELDPTAIAKFRSLAASTGADLVAASVRTSTSILRPMRGQQWRNCGNAYVASHAVGTLINRDLHITCGRYSNRYVNCADMHFILSAVINGRAKIVASNFIAGTFNVNGVSSIDRICSICDVFRIQLAFGSNKFIQLFICIGRLTRALLFPRRCQQC